MTESLPEDGFVLGGPLSSLQVTVRLLGDELDPDEITRLLGVTPIVAARKGDTVVRGSSSVTQRIGVWSYGLTEDASPDWELEDAIVAVLGRLPGDLNLWSELGARFSIDMFCGLFMGSGNQGADVSPSTLRLLADRGMRLGLDIYGPPLGDEAT